MEKTNKTQAVLNYLKQNGSLTSMQAFELFGATRLASIVFCLRKKYDIDSIDMECVDRYGHVCHFAKYVYKGEIGDE